ncbi:hypothetical protein EZS27_034548 [termite gut metagenome]|jgi:hypothetical protein|uniref:Uncharacterized protein n=1 Tax=termite gut metagenome TaxID=433724 RepID=A0A5J4Q0F8_9ZZZZ
MTPEVKKMYDDIEMLKREKPKGYGSRISILMKQILLSTPKTEEGFKEMESNGFKFAW